MKRLYLKNLHFLDINPYFIKKRIYSFLNNETDEIIRKNYKPRKEKLTKNILNYIASLIKINPSINVSTYFKMKKYTFKKAHYLEFRTLQ